MEDKPISFEFKYNPNPQIKLDPLPPDWPWKNCGVGMAGPFKRMTMTIEEALRYIEASKEYSYPGEFSIDSGVLIWYYNLEFHGEETHDKLWDAHCEANEFLTKVFGQDGYETKDTWADNDSCGFEVIIKKQILKPA